MKHLISFIAGSLLGILIMVVINFLPKPYADNDMLKLNNFYIPTLKLVSDNVKLVSSDVGDKEIILEYDTKSAKKEVVSDYYDKLQKYGYRSLKNEWEEENGEFIQVLSAGENKLIYVICEKNTDVVSIKYNLEEGSIEIFEDEKFFVNDARNEYYDVKIDDKTVKIPSVKNIADLTMDTDISFEFTNHINLYHRYAQGTTSEQKEGYLNKYGNLLLDNGFVQGENKREYHNNFIKIKIENDRWFHVYISKNVAN